MNKLSWFSTLASIAGAFLVAFGVIPMGYICFGLGSITALIVWGYRKDLSLITLNATFLIANIIGIYRAFA